MTTVAMKGIVKQFGNLIANNRIDIDFFAGEVHALLGENGAGKTTLMKILAGLFEADAGEIFLDGARTAIQSPSDASRLGIGMVHQHFMLVGPLSVAQNFIIGLRGVPAIPAMTALRKEILQLSSRYHLDVDPDALIWQQSVGEQQRVELLRLLHRGAQVLILYEPTSVLTPQEARQLGLTLRALAQEGKTIILITHKLNEVLEFADRVSVLRRGTLVVTVGTSQTDALSLAELMVDRFVQPSRQRTQPIPPGEVKLAVQNVTAAGDRALTAIDGITFEVHRGEIFGIAGVAGNGQHELVEVIVGLRRATRGKVLLDKVDITNADPARLIAQGVGYIPQNRITVGTIEPLSVADNLILKKYARPPLSRGPWLVHRSIQAFAAKMIERFRIKAASVTMPVRHLSGGNIQKLVVGREIDAQRGLIVAESPTQGLDIGATQSIHEILQQEATRGAAILLVSEDLEELMALCDRIAVIFRGRIMGIVESDKVNMEQIGLLMAGMGSDTLVSSSHETVGR